MTAEQITVRFSSEEQLSAALADLRRAGAVSPLGWPPGPGGLAPTLHFSVPARQAALARAIVRRAGGRLCGS